MISAEEIDRTILELENKDTSFAVCEKLAWLYICRDHISPQKATEQRIFDVPDNADEFTRIALKTPQERLVDVMDDLMQAMQLVYPKQYKKILEMLTE